MADQNTPSKPEPYQPNSAVPYGGASSQGGAADLRSRAQARPPMAITALKATAIAIAAAPLVLAAIFSLMGGNPAGFALYLGIFALFGLAAWLIRDGIAAAEAYETKQYALAPGLPKKLIGSAVAGLALFLTGVFGWQIGGFQSVILGLLGAGAAILAFRPDPMTTKGKVVLGGISAAEVASAISEAEDKLDSIARISTEINDAPLRERMADVVTEGRAILRRIEEDPADLRRAKKFMVVYLDGALDATRKYADNQDDDAVSSGMYLKFRSLLDDMIRAFKAQHEVLLRDDRMDLDVEIDVLAERLKQDSAL